MKNTAVNLIQLVSNYSDLIALILIAATTNTAVQVKQAREINKLFTVVDTVLAMLIASGSGTLFAVVAALYLQEERHIYAMAGAGAFLGLKGLNALTDFALKIVRAQIDGRSK